MTSTEIIFIVGGLLLGYWTVASLFNKKLVSSTSKHSDNNSDNRSQENRAQNEAPGNDNSGEKDCIPGSWFRILEVSESACQKQIAAAYKQKIRQYHPDKVAQMGAEIREVAEFKSKQINAAYDHAMRLRG